MYEIIRGVVVDVTLDVDGLSQSQVHEALFIE